MRPLQPMPTEQQFVIAADRVLQTVADALARGAAGRVTCERAGDLLAMRFDDGVKCSLIRQNPIRQVWLAEGPLAWYFDWRPDRGLWLDGRGRGTLGDVLQELFARHLGTEVPLPALEA